jgi:catechol 2,3-dioxygenase-like lactoylglutathione lyase family enzyme
MKPKKRTIALEEIGLNVSDLDVSEAFYQEVFGLRVAHESLEFPFRYASMARDGETVFTLCEQPYSESKNALRDSLHLVFETQSAEELNRIAGILDNLGARWSEGARRPEQSVPLSIRFEDPDGIAIEVFRPDSRKTAAKGTECINLAHCRLTYITEKEHSHAAAHS